MFIKPDYNLENIYEIDFDKLKKQGIKCIMFDLDSTVMKSKSAEFNPDTIAWFNTFINDFEVAIISNNNKKEYIKRYQQQFHIANKAVATLISLKKRKNS